MLRQALTLVLRELVGLYFTSIEEVGERPPSTTRSRMLVANHVNALIDPLLVITRAPCPLSPIAKSTLWKIPVLSALLDVAGAVPVVRRRDEPGKSAESNDAIFEKVAGFMAGGGNILVFPEGTSHNEPQLQRLRTGSARMLVRAEMAGASDATFQAVGLEFEARDTFRSRALLVYGPVHRVADCAPGAALDDRVSEITERMRADLSELLVEGDTWSERMLIARVAEILRNETGARTLAEWNSIGRQVEAAKKAFAASDPVRIAEVSEVVTHYFELLEQAGLTDDALATHAPERSAKEQVAAWLRVVALPVALLGALLYVVPYQLPRLVAARSREVDEHSTLKLATGLMVFPLWAAILATLGFVFLRPGWGWLALALLVIAPFVTLDWQGHRGGVARAFSLAKRARLLTDLARARARALERIEKGREAFEAV